MKLDELVRGNHTVTILSDIDRDEAERLINYPLRHLASPTVRLVNPAPAFYRACMGTHVARTGDIGLINIRKMKMRKGMVVVGYELAT